MKSVDIGGLVTGLITVILLAVSIGKYDDLQRFARKEFARSLTAKGWHSAPFFPKQYKNVSSKK